MTTMSSSMMMTMMIRMMAIIDTICIFRACDHCVAMSEDWVGCRVSLDCAGLGFFQGVICRINLGEQTVTIEKPFQNGLAVKFPEITLNASDIQVIRIKFKINF